MNVLNVKIVCPDGEIFNENAASILITTDSGEIQIMKGHADLIAPIKTGRAKLGLPDGTERSAAASGGFVCVSKGDVTVVATTFEFADTIDLDRALKAREKAEELLKNSKTDKEIELARAKLARAISRISVASSK